MRIRISLMVVLMLPAMIWADEVPAPTGDAIVDPAARLEKLFTRTANIKGGLTEGPACAPDGSIYFSDIPIGSDDKGLIMRFDPKTRETTVFAEDSGKSNGLKFDAMGRLIACEGADNGGRAVTARDVKTKKRTVLADSYKGKRFNAPNDLAIDAKGRIYFSDPKYVGAEKRELDHMAVYRIDGNDVVEITHEVEKPNGVALSPDNKTLYVVDHNNRNERLDNSPNPEKKGAMKFYAFPLGDDGLVNGPRRTLVDLGEENGFDGLTVDDKGNLYLAQRSLKRPGILVINPEGKEVAFIPTGVSQPGAKEPVGVPSNCCFGAGDEKNVLYITVDMSLYRIKLKSAGAKLAWEK